MKTLLHSVKIISPGSKHHGKQRDILIEKGKIIAIGTKLDDPEAKSIQGKDLHISPGWIDLRVNFRDPGEEWKEDLNSGLEAAALGGFTQVVQMPSTDPVIDSKSSLEYLLNRAQGHAVKLHAAAALSKGMKAEGLSEMFDLHTAGACLFTDDKHPVVNTELMHRALEYTKNFNGTVMSIPFDSGICPGGLMHEGKMSTALGLKGIPVIAETLCLQRDLDLLRYTSGKLHVSLLSSAEGVELIRKAKKEGLNVTADVSAAHLLFCDEDLEGYDSNFKTLPPFRATSDRKALIKGIKDGTIDAICSDHSPHDIEAKQKEFEHAEFGFSGIEATFSAALEALGSDQESLEIIVNRLSLGPASLLGLPHTIIEEGADADFTLFSTSKEWVYNRETIKSKSIYSPFLNKKFKGKALGIWRGRHRKLF